MKTLSEISGHKILVHESGVLCDIIRAGIVTLDDFPKNLYFIKAPKRAFYFEREVNYGWHMLKRMIVDRWKKRFVGLGKISRRMYSPFSGAIIIT